MNTFVYLSLTYLGINLKTVYLSFYLKVFTENVLKYNYTLKNILKNEKMWKKNKDFKNYI